MSKSRAEALLALVLYPPILLLALFLRTGMASATSILKYEAWFTLFGSMVLALLWIAKVDDRLRGLLYVVGMLLSGFLHSLWQYHKYISKPDYGWGFFFEGFWMVLPLHLASGCAVLFVLWLFRMSRRPSSQKVGSRYSI